MRPDTAIRVDRGTRRRKARRPSHHGTIKGRDAGADRAGRYDAAVQPDVEPAEAPNEKICVGPRRESVISSGAQIESLLAPRMADCTYGERLLVWAVRWPGLPPRRESRHGRARAGVNWRAHACAACCALFGAVRGAPDQAQQRLLTLGMEPPEALN